MPGTLPGMNEIIRADKSSPYAYREINKLHTESIAWEAVRQKVPFYDKADFRIMWYCPDRRHDKDNVVVGAKSIRDGRVEAGVLKNDGWAQVGAIEHYFAVDNRNPRLEVEIKEASA